MIPVLLTITVTIGIILIGLLFFVLGKLNWLETATNSLPTKLTLQPQEKRPKRYNMTRIFMAYLDNLYGTA